MIFQNLMKRYLYQMKGHFNTFQIFFCSSLYLNYSRRNLRKKSGARTPNLGAVPPFLGRTGRTA
jgi:hypothetical protein